MKKTTPLSLLDPIIIKCVHDLVSPLSGVIMAVEMIEEEDTLNLKEGIEVIHSALEKMKASLLLWRLVFSVFQKPTHPSEEIKEIFTTFLTEHRSSVKVESTEKEIPAENLRLAGLLFLMLNDRLTFIQEGTLEFSSQSATLIGKYERGDLFDRAKKVGENSSALFSLMLQEAKECQRSMVFSSSPFLWKLSSL